MTDDERRELGRLIGNDVGFSGDYGVNRRFLKMLSRIAIEESDRADRLENEIRVLISRIAPRVAYNQPFD